MATQFSTPTASQYASASTHLEQPITYVRTNGIRYAVVTSGTSGRVYQVRADASACADHCIWWTRTRTQCSHMLAVELSALESELWQAQVDVALGPQSKPRASYDELFPACREGCGELVDGLDGRCNRCASDREWEERRTVQRQRIEARYL
jgi:hypothetical protein